MRSERLYSRQRTCILRSSCHSIWCRCMGRRTSKKTFFNMRRKRCANHGWLYLTNNLIEESGWPSAGQSNGVAVPSQINQATANAGILSSMGNKCVLFSAFNDQWKNPGQHGVEQYWVCHVQIYNLIIRDYSKSVFFFSVLLCRDIYIMHFILNICLLCVRSVIYIYIYIFSHPAVTFEFSQLAVKHLHAQLNYQLLRN